MLKLMGAGITVASCGAMGFHTCRGMRRRIRILQQLRQMTVMLNSEITYANATLEEAFAHMEKRFQAPLNGFFHNLSEKLREGEHGLLCEIFKSQVQKDLADSGLKQSDLESLGMVGEQLGYPDIQIQKKNLEYYLEQVNEACMQAQQEYREKEKMFRCLGISAGVFLVILFY